MRFYISAIFVKTTTSSKDLAYLAVRARLSSYHFVSHVIKRASAYVDEHRMPAYDINSASSDFRNEPSASSACCWHVSHGARSHVLTSKSHIRQNYLSFLPSVFSQILPPKITSVRSRTVHIAFVNTRCKNIKREKNPTAI